MTDKPAPLLTAERAAEWVKYWIGPSDDDKALLNAIATGRTRVIEPMSEKAAREAFKKYFPEPPAGSHGSYLWDEHQDTWLAALRHIGAIANEGEGG